MNFAQTIGLHSSSLRALFVKLFVTEMKHRKSKALDNLLFFVCVVYPYASFLLFMLLANGNVSTATGMVTLAYLNGFALSVGLLAFRHDFVSVRDAIAEVFASYPRMKRALYSTAEEAWFDDVEEGTPRTPQQTTVPHLREVGR